MSFVVIIPARYASTRLPGKPLVDINGKPMIVHVLERARESGVDRVIVATDHPDVAQAVEAAGGEVCMTRADHQSGTERLAEVVEKCGFSDDTVIVNVQGDEPFIIPQQIESLISCFEEPTIQIATLAKPFEKNDDIFDPNKVKVVFSARNTALYFSRNPIPYCRGVERDGWLARTPYYKHVGMYAYRPQILKAVTSIPQGILEQAESLEQLRWLENGYTIAISITDHESIGIDTPEDLEKIII